MGWRANAAMPGSNRKAATPLLSAGRPVRIQLQRTHHVTTKVCFKLAIAAIISLLWVRVPRVDVAWVHGWQLVLNRHCTVKQFMSAGGLQAAALGEKVSGTVVKRTLSGDLIVDIGEATSALIPAISTRNQTAERAKVGDEVDVWLTGAAKSDNFKFYGTARREFFMTPERTEKFKKVARSEEFLDGVVEHVRHPFAEVMVKLKDGSTGLGKLHANDLGKGWVEDIRDHVSMGDRMSVRVLEVAAGTGQLSLSMRRSLMLGQELEGIVHAKLPSGAVLVDIGEGMPEVQLPHREVAERLDDKLEVGDRIASIWIKSLDNDKHKVIGTLQDGRALSPAAQRKFLAAKKLDGGLGGVVTRVSDSNADVMVNLQDGTRGLGRLHASDLSQGEDISEHLSVGDDIRVSIRDVSAKTGHLSLSICLPLRPGQKVEGIVTKLLASGAAIIAVGQEAVHLSDAEVARLGDDLQVGDRISPLWIAGITERGGLIGTIQEGRALTPQVLKKFSAARDEQPEFLFDGLVDRIQHPFAEVYVKLPDGTQGLGRLHAQELGRGWIEDISDYLSEGDTISVRILEVAAETGSLSLSAVPPLIPGQRYAGAVLRILKSGGAIVDTDDGRGTVLIPSAECAGRNLQPGDGVGSLWVTSIGERGAVGALKKPTLLSGEAHEKLPATEEKTEDGLDGMAQGTQDAAFNSTFAVMTAAGEVAVDAGDGRRALELAYAEVTESENMQLGGTLPHLWIIAGGDGRASGMLSSSAKRYLLDMAAKDKERQELVFEAEVESLEHAFADVVLLLRRMPADAEQQTGRLRSSKLGKSRVEDVLASMNVGESDVLVRFSRAKVVDHKRQSRDSHS